MKKLLTCLLSLSSASVALAQSERADFNGFFAQAHALYADIGDIKSTGGASAVVGYRFLDHHSIDLDVSRFESESITFTPFFLGYKYNQALSQNWNGYLGFGAGIMDQQLESYYRGGDTTSVFAFDVGASYNLNKHVALNFNAKSFGAQESDITTKGNIALFRIGLEIR